MLDSRWSPTCWESESDENFGVAQTREENKEMKEDAYDFNKICLLKKGNRLAHFKLKSA